MWRVLLGVLFWCASSLSAPAADPQQVMQGFFGMVQEFQRLDAEQRQQREAQIQQLISACQNYEEAACQEIIDTPNMKPLTNFFAFMHVGDLEYERGQKDEAQKSYQYALKWARKSNRPSAISSAKEKLAALAAEAAQSVAAIPSPPPAAPVTTLPANPVCDGTDSVEWQIACLQASRSEEGAGVYAKLSESLREHRTTLPALLQCEADFKNNPTGIMACYRSRGITEAALQDTREQVLDYELVIDDHQPAKGN